MTKDNLHTTHNGKVVAKTCKACKQVLMPSDLKDNRRSLCAGCNDGRETLQDWKDHPEIYGEGF